MKSWDQIKEVKLPGRQAKSHLVDGDTLYVGLKDGVAVCLLSVFF